MSSDTAELQEIAEELHRHYPRREFAVCSREALGELRRRRFLQAKALARKKRKGQA